ncbi:MAG: hypothetical protein KF684_00810 [Phycisphaeraceae bacterium]|nr:hypothetical protein [Phycisphaeraceae bacterium]
MRTGTRLLIALAMAAMGWQAAGQTNASPGAPQQRAAQQDRETPRPTQSPWIDLKFKGGTMADLVRTIKEAQPRANVLLEPDAASWKIPAFEAFGVTPAAALEIARNLLEDPNALRVVKVGMGDDSAPATAVRLGDRARHERENDANPREPRLPSNAPAKAWNLKNWLDGNTQTISGALAAIQIGMETYSIKPVIKYHEPTGVLMVRATGEQINFIESILEAALQSPSNLQTPDHLEQQIRATETRITKMQGASSVRNAELRAAMAAAKGARDLEESEHAIAEREVIVARAKAALAEIDDELARAIQYRDDLKRRLEELRRQTPGS